MAKVAVFPKVYRVGRKAGTFGERRSTRGLKTRATRFANDVYDDCKWYFTGKNRQNRAKVNAMMERLWRRRKIALAPDRQRSPLDLDDLF